jgi:hypothetical protein
MDRLRMQAKINLREMVACGQTPIISVALVPEVPFA